MGALEKQVGGSHYKNFKIQPIEFTTRNNLGFIQGDIQQGFKFLYIRAAVAADTGHKRGRPQHQRTVRHVGCVMVDKNSRAAFGQSGESGIGPSR